MAARSSSQLEMVEGLIHHAITGEKLAALAAGSQTLISSPIWSCDTAFTPAVLTNSVDS
jgi:hypothetical protein